MTTLALAREALSEAISDAGLECLPYGPDSPSPPLSWIDDIGVDFTGGGAGGTFCLPGVATATIVAVAQRNDRPGAVTYLENWLPLAVDAVTEVPGVRILTATEGELSVGGQELPSILMTVQFFV